MDKIFDKACLYNISYRFYFLRVLGRIKSFGSVNLGKFYRVGRVTLNRQQKYFLIWPKDKHEYPNSKLSDRVADAYNSSAVGKTFVHMQTHHVGQLDWHTLVECVLQTENVQLLKI